MKLLRDPLTHFLLIGALLFLAYRLFNLAPAAGPDEIRVSRGHIDQLAATFTRTWQRPPTADELKGLVDGDVREQMLAREAVKLGLDTDDTIIRRRLQQKMDFIIGDLGGAMTPDDETLQQYLEDHPDRFRSPATYSLQQVYLNPEKRQESLASDADTLLTWWRNGEGDYRELADTSLDNLRRN